MGDISYLRTWEGWAYVATVIDLHSRRVVGFSVASHMRASLVCDALKMALAQLVYRRALPTIAEPRHAVFEYIEVFYNRKRIHSALGYRSPVDYEASTPPVLAASPAA